MNIGPLSLGDYLGIFCPYFATEVENFLPFLYSSWVYIFRSIDCSNWSNIFCYRFSLHIAGTFSLHKLYSIYLLDCNLPEWLTSNIMVQVLNQDETPLLYSLVFGEGVVNDATSVVLFNAIQNFDLSHIDTSICLQFFGNFLYLFIASTVLGVLVSRFPLIKYMLMLPYIFVIYSWPLVHFFILAIRLDFSVLTLLEHSHLEGL